MMSRLRLKTPSARALTLGLLGLALLGAMAFVMGRTGPLAPVRVTAAQARVAPLAPALFGIGTVEARRSYLIGPTSAARVLRVAVDVGEQVRAGQLLAEMDPVDLDQRLAALDASLARADSAIAAAQAQTQDAAARQALAAANARRYADLGQQNFVSPGAVEARQQEQTSAAAGAQAAQANLQAARQDRLRLAAERAALLQQRRNTRLLATADGVVVAREAEPGSTVVAGQAVLRVVDPASLWIRTRFDQGRSAGLAPGLAATVALRARPGQTLPGRVARVELLGDSVTEERVAQVTLDAPPADLSVGELAEVTLQLPASAPAVLLPNAAVRRVQGQAGVWLLEDGGQRFAPLRLGLAGLDGQVQVLEGLTEGATVVVYSEKDIDAGTRLKVVQALVEPAR